MGRPSKKIPGKVVVTQTIKYFVYTLHDDLDNHNQIIFNRKNEYRYFYGFDTEQEAIEYIMEDCKYDTMDNVVILPVRSFSRSWQ